MSWIVRETLLSSNSIEDNLFRVDDSTGTYIMDFDNTEYEDLLTIAEEIRKQIDSGLITKEELDLIYLLSHDRSYLRLARKLGVSKLYVRTLFENICNRIAYSLGGKYTNDGYIEYVTEKYKLNKAQIEKLKKEIGLNND